LFAVSDGVRRADIANIDHGGGGGGGAHA